MAISMADLKRMRETREARMEANKAQVHDAQREYLLTGNLAKGSALWFPDEPLRLKMRILDFMVGKKDNIAGDEVGHFTAIRKIMVHYLPNKQMGVCPRCYGEECLYCDTYHDNYDEIKHNHKHPAARLKAKKIALFNALIGLPSESGKERWSVQVVRGSQFFTTDKIYSALKIEEELNPKAELYNFSDLELGYYFQTAFAMKEAVEGNKDKFMQIVKCEPLWDTKRTMVPESVLDRITDLDAIIPPPISREVMEKSLGSLLKAKADDNDVDVDGDDLDIPDDFTAIEPPKSTSTTVALGGAVKKEEAVDLEVPGEELVEPAKGARESKQAKPKAAVKRKAEPAKAEEPADVSLEEALGSLEETPATDDNKDGADEFDASDFDF